MRRIFTAALFFVFAAFAIPALSVWEPPARQEVNRQVELPSPKVKVLVSETGEVKEIPLEEYLVGVVAAEMPAKFPEEALKAQAVAARTFTLKRIHQKPTGNSLHPKADICTDHNHCQAWKDDVAMRKEWGQAYAEYKGKIRKAVYETQGQAIYYQSGLIDPVYHSTSNGRTENSEDVWQSKVPYLRSVVSIWDRQSPKFRSSVEVPVETVFRVLGGKTGVQQVSTGGGDIIKVLAYTATGRIKTVSVAGNKMSANQLRRALGLPSTDLSWTVKGGKVIFQAIGNGHGVGMSQYGAKGMAQEGKSYQEILHYFYTGVNVKKAY